jgi:hypothetical protein
MNFENVKKDYVRLIDDYGFPEDMTGGFVDAEKMEKVIRNPTKKNAANYMKSVIEYGFQMGDFWNTEINGKISIHGDKFLEKCYAKYA